GPLEAAAGLEVTGAAELAGAEADTGAADEVLAAGVDDPPHAARLAVASAAALMVRTVRPTAASKAAWRARESKVLLVTVISPISVYARPPGKGRYQITAAAPLHFAAPFHRAIPARPGPLHVELLAPHLAGGLDDQLELGRLLLLGQGVAL